MEHGLKDKVAIVTAASRGLGRERLHAKVIAVARGESELGELAAAFPGHCIPLVGDLRDPDLPQRAVERALALFGTLDIVVANTAGPPSMLPLEAKESDVASAFDTVFYPAFRLIQAATRPMLERRHGRIVIVSSTSIKAPKPFLCLSAASRSALWAWAKSAAPQLFESGITINAVLAGPHDTERARQLGVKNKPMGRPDDFGAFVTFLAGEHARFITGTGHMVDGGEFTGV